MALSTKRKNLLCDEKITDESAFRSWAKTNHPDKGGNEAKFKSVSACKSNGFCPPEVSLLGRLGARSATSLRRFTPSAPRFGDPESVRSVRSARSARDAKNLESSRRLMQKMYDLQQVLPPPAEPSGVLAYSDYSAGGKGTRRHYYNYKKTRKGRVNKIYSKKRKTLRRKKYKKN